MTTFRIYTLTATVCTPSEIPHDRVLRLCADFVLSLYFFGDCFLPQTAASRVTSRRSAAWRLSPRPATSATRPATSYVFFSNLHQPHLSQPFALLLTRIFLSTFCLTFFQSRECPTNPAPAAGGAGGECYKCGQHGHIARACPTAGPSSRGGFGGARGGRSCYNCGGVGHLSRDCTSPQGAAAGGQRCYNCNESGHISRECPKPQTKSCYVSPTPLSHLRSELLGVF